MRRLTTVLLIVFMLASVGFGVIRGRLGVGDGFSSLASTTNCITVTPRDSVALKYAELVANGNMGTLSATNRRALILLPGVHTLTETLTLATNFVDIVGIGSPDDTVVAGAVATYLVLQTANDVRLENLTFRQLANADTRNDVLVINSTDNSASIYRTCNFRSTSAVKYSKEPVRGESDLGGTWYNCKSDAGGWRTAASKNLTATMYDCEAGVDSFGGDQDNTRGTGVISGNFYRCKAGYASFGGCGGFGMSCTGYFEDCVSGNNSFGLGMVASGTFIRCQSGMNSFAGYTSLTDYGTASGIFIDCVADGGNSFGMGNAGCVQSGVFIRCRNGNSERTSNVANLVNRGPSTLTNGEATASYTFTFVNGTITITSLVPGTLGNGVNFAILKGALSNMTTNFSSETISIACIRNLTTPGTADAICTAINANATANKFIIATHDGNDVWSVAGSELSSLASYHPLAGGANRLTFESCKSDSPISCTSATTVYAFDNGATYTNTGTSGAVTFTLPAAILGLKYKFIRTEAAATKDIVLQAIAGSTIDGGADAGSISNTADEVAYITLECVTAGAWLSTLNPKSGTWQ
jgi:hypothetical protein